MIDLYYWPTPNGHKITIMLEELGIPYKIIPINIKEGQQFQADFLKIAPNNKIPAIVDHAPAIVPATASKEPLALFESGAILLYLADKTKEFIPQDTRGRYDVLQWLFWQMAALGPMLGQNHHFVQYAPEKITYAIERYVKETARLYTVLDQQLSQKEFIAGAYSIADMACYPWVLLYENQLQNINDYPNIKRWLGIIQDRPAIKRAYAIVEQPNFINATAPLNKEEKEVLFQQDACSILRKPKSE